MFGSLLYFPPVYPMSKQPDKETLSKHPIKRRPGRPPTYIFSKPDSELSENELRLKGSVVKRRLRQNRSYHRKKRLKELAEQATIEPEGAVSTSSRLPHATQTQHSPTIVPLCAAALPSAPIFSSSSSLSQQYLRPLPISHTAVTRRTEPDLLAFLTAEAAKHESPKRTTADTPSLPTPNAFALPLSDNAISDTINLALRSSSEIPTNDVSYGSALNFDCSMIRLPTTNCEVHVDDSGGTPFLYVGTSTPSIIKEDSALRREDEDEAQLIAGILDAYVEKNTSSTTSKLRPTGSSNFLTPGLDVRPSALPEMLLSRLKYLVLFAGSFTEDAALRVMGLGADSTATNANVILKPLVDVNLMRQLPSERYELNDITKSLVSIDSLEDATQARQRFVSYFMELLRQLDPTCLVRNARERMNAIKVYDMEQRNIRAALQMCRDMGNKGLLMQFLTHGSAVMRYSTPARERIEIFGNVLNDIRGLSGAEKTDPLATARLFLALGEAYFDSLCFEKAEDHLRQAIALMAENEDETSPVALSVLALLLLAELRISDRDFDEAKKLLAQALKALKDGNLQRSTFAVCCLLNIASVSAATGHFDNATLSVKSALSLLTDLGFSHMPVYADALGTLGTVHMQKGNNFEAQTFFSSALNIIQNWMHQKDWARAPFQHCTHLDIFLVEAIAEVKTEQKKFEEASQLLARAQQQREKIGLPLLHEYIRQEEGVGDNGRLYTRHLY